MVRLHDVWCAF